ncbi:MAG: bi-domain-containing oxidoreductase [Candidatus Hydrothermarchaeota archaeon]
MKQVLIKRGKVTVEELPIPTPGDNEVLVKTCYSLISAGTEAVSLSNTESYIGFARKHPEKVKKVLRMIREKGLIETYQKVQGILESANPIGYSLSGIVVDVGKDVRDIKVGDLVACAGAGKANHAEFVSVSRNLVVRVPEKVNLRDASSATIGAIALQGVRRADPKIGEFVVVIGLGLIGLITVQILKANGCKVVGIDIEERRVKLAKKLGIDKSVVAGPEDPVREVLKFTENGADSVIITAATKSSEVINQAMEMCRKKGKVVIVGDIGLKLDRRPFYERELDLLISTSYGPGRYDVSYEEDGIDYPYAYVRWTENRNMQAYLDLIADGKINFDLLVEREYTIEEAVKAFEDLLSESRPIAIVLKYPHEEFKEEKKKIIIKPKKISSEKINTAIIGAGSFATSTHLPNLKKLSEYYDLKAVVTKTPHKAKQIAERFEAEYATTDYREVLEDPSVDMVLISTRHNLHARIAIEAAKKGKAIFLEKPMALNEEELEELTETLKNTQVPFMVGFNRRFSPHAKEVKRRLENRDNPIMILYRVNAGFLPRDHWVHSEEGGGRIIGEACHMFDLFNYLVDSNVISIDASAIKPQFPYEASDNFVATVKYEDGSVATLLYTALGPDDLPKEYIEVYCGEKVFIINDFKKLTVKGEKGGIEIQDKGLLQELLEFALALKEGKEMPISLDDMILATKISFEVDKMIKRGA